MGKLEKEIKELRQIVESLKEPKVLAKPTLHTKLMKHLSKSNHFKSWLDGIEANNPDISVDDIVFNIQYKAPKVEYFFDEVNTDTGKGATREILDNNISDKQIRKAMEKKHLVKDTDEKGDAIIYPEE